MLHADDFVGDFTAEFEVKLEGRSDPTGTPLACTLPGWEKELQLIHAPGHTAGSLFILYKEKFLFTGDSLGYSRVEGHLVADRLHCWQSWSLQLASLRQLLAFPFLYLLPGHGEHHRFASKEEATASLEKCLAWAEQFPGGYTPMGQFRLWVGARTSTHNKWVRWVVDYVLLPRGARLSLPVYRPVGGGGRVGGRVASSVALAGVLGVVSVGVVVLGRTKRGGSR